MKLRSCQGRQAVGLLASGVILGACSDFRLVGPEPNRPARLWVSVHTVHDTTSAYHVEAVFHPGTDEAGEPNASTFRLKVNGEAIEPKVVHDRWTYRWSRISAGIRRRDTVTIEAPDVSGLPSSGSFSIPITYSDDSPRVELARGRSLQLHVSPLPRISPKMAEVMQWELRIGRDPCIGLGSSALRIVDRTAYPAALVLPWSWLEPHAATLTGACFESFSLHTVRTGPYLINLNHSTRIAWNIALVANQ